MSTYTEFEKRVLALLQKIGLYTPPPPPLVSLEVFGTNIQEGTSVRYTCIGAYEDDSLKDISEEVTWEAEVSATGAAIGSWNGSLLTIPNNSVSQNTTIIVRATHAATQLSASKIFTITNVAPTLALVEVTGSNINEGSTANFTATARYSDGSSTNVTAQASWIFSEGSFNAATGVLTMPSNATQGDTRNLTVSATYQGVSSGNKTYQIINTTAQAPTGDALAFPSATGFGRNTRGAWQRFKETGNTADLPAVYFVDNTANSGAGSFRDAVMASGPRLVIIRTGGTCMLSSAILITSPYITIVGTGTGGGFCLRGNPVTFRTSHFVVRNIKHRNGVDNSTDGMAVSAGGSKIGNGIFDHCTVTWSADENLSCNGTNGGVENVTIQNCLFGEGFAGHSFGTLLNGQAANTTHVRNISIHRNLYINCEGRMPVAVGYHNSASVVNNIAYNWKSQAAQVMDDSFGDFIRNYFKIGPVTQAQVNGIPKCVQVLWDGTSPKCRFYINNNVRSDGGSTIYENRAGGNDNLSPTQTWNNTIYGFEPMMPGPALEADLLQKCGAFPKDAVDTRMINDYNNGTGAAPATASQMSYPSLSAGTYPANNMGIPLTWLVEKGYASNTTNAAALSSSFLKNPANGMLGYSIVERYLHTLNFNGDQVDPFTAP